jgi:hypothetical protein
MLFLFLSPVFVLWQISPQLPFWLTQLLLAKNQLSEKGSDKNSLLPKSGQPERWIVLAIADL